MATKTINDLTALNAVPADDDALIIRDSSGPNDRKLLAKWFAKTDGTEVTFTGGGVGVTTTAAQTLSGPKTLTAPVIADFTAATHDHADAAGGGNTLLVPTIASFANAAHDHSDAAGGGLLDMYSSGVIHVWNHACVDVTAAASSLFNANGASATEFAEGPGFWLNADKIGSNQTVKVYIRMFNLGNYSGVVSLLEGASTITTVACPTSSSTLETKISADCRASLTAGINWYNFEIDPNHVDNEVYIVAVAIVID